MKNREALKTSRSLETPEEPEDKLKMKISDLESRSDKRGFNESELFASSVDLTRTPLRTSLGHVRTPNQMMSPPVLEPVNEETSFMTKDNQVK